jgi:hypothetical protein
MAAVPAHKRRRLCLVIAAVCRHDCADRLAQQLARQGQAGLAAAVGQQPVVPDPVEAARQCLTTISLDPQLLSSMLCVPIEEAQTLYVRVLRQLRHGMQVWCERLADAHAERNVASCKLCLHLLRGFAWSARAEPLTAVLVELATDKSGSDEFFARIDQAFLECGSVIEHLDMLLSAAAQ